MNLTGKGQESDMDRWLTKHGWITSKPGKTAKFMSYLAFIFIFPCAVAALIELIIFKKVN